MDKTLKPKKLSKEHKNVLKIFLKDVLSKNLSRDEIIDFINKKFIDENLEPIYCKSKLSNAIANIRFIERNNKKIKKTIIKIKNEPEYIYQKKNKIDKLKKDKLNKISNEPEYIYQKKNKIDKLKKDKLSKNKTEKIIDIKKNIQNDISLLNDDFLLFDEKYSNIILNQIKNCKELPTF